MYTTTILTAGNVVVINTILGIMLAAAVIVFVVSLVGLFKSDWFERLLICIPLVISGMGVVAAVQTINENTPPKVYRNEPVVAHRLDHIGLKAESSGKYQATLAGYVAYQVPEGVVHFRMSSGQVWPNVAVLYKQDASQ